MPRTLHHLDCLSIGGTTFIVHVHENEPPCVACSPHGGEEIPLSQHRNTEDASGSSKKRKVGAPPLAPPLTHPRDRDHKKALNSLKRSLLSTKDVGHVAPHTGPQYVDRSAKRRALHPDHSASASISAAAGTSSSSTSTNTPPLPPPPAASKPTPISSTNVGHRLLMKHGWTPGSALGIASTETTGLTAPLDPPSTVGRAGIGAPVRTPTSMATAQDGNWKAEGKHRRWAEFRTNGSDPGP